MGATKTSPQHKNKKRCVSYKCDTGDKYDTGERLNREGARLSSCQPALARSCGHLSSVNLLAKRSGVFTGCWQER